MVLHTAASYLRPFCQKSRRAISGADRDGRSNPAIRNPHSVNRAAALQVSNCIRYTFVTFYLPFSPRFPSLKCLLQSDT